MANRLLNVIKGHPDVTGKTAYPLLKDKFGFTFAQIGIITLVFQLASSVFQPFIGNYSDKHPQPYSLACGMCFTLAGLLALAFAPNYGLILLSVALIGCGSSVFHPEASRVAQLASGGKKSLAQSIFQVGGNGGSAFGPLLAALIVIPYGQHAVGVFALAALLAALLLTRVGCWYSIVLTRTGTDGKTAGTSAGGFSGKTVRNAFAILIFGLMFGLGGIGSAFFGWLADLTSIAFIFNVSTLLPLLGVVAVFLPDIRNTRIKLT